MTADPLSLAADLLDPPAWEPQGRPPLEPHQVPPVGDWTLWLLQAGRGAGKTEACARYFASYMRANPGHRGRIIAPTLGDAVEACITGPSGLLAMDPEIAWHPSAIGGAKVRWPNGSEALVIGTPNPRDVDRLRAGGNRHIDWWEEMAANPQLQDAWDQAAYGLRLGDHPHAIASTTPRMTTAFRAIRAQAGVALVRASLFDNPHLPKKFVDQMVDRYEGTRLGRQELHGELLEDVEGALWSPRVLEACRVFEHPDLVVVAVAVDPAATSTAGSDDTGIVAGGVGIDGKCYILADRTCHLDPDGWGTRVIRTYKKLDADHVVGEVNNGGEMVEKVVQAAAEDQGYEHGVPFRPVRASRGKQTRAEPVAALFGNPPKRPPRVHLVGSFPEMEDQLCTWVPEDAKSPDRLDALVWLVTDLMLADDEHDEYVETWEPVRIGPQI